MQHEAIVTPSTLEVKVVSLIKQSSIRSLWIGTNEAMKYEQGAHRLTKRATHPIKLAFTVALLLTSMVASAEASVRVNFVNPSQYHDEDFRSFKRDGIIAELQKEFDRLDRVFIKRGQALSIDVLDIELAGRYEPWRTGFSDVRILRDITPPSFKIRYTLRQGRAIVMRGEETITDMNYLWDPSARTSSERLAHEKRLLRDWFRRRFQERGTPRG